MKILGTRAFDKNTTDDLITAPIANPAAEKINYNVHDEKKEAHTHIGWPYER